MTLTTRKEGAYMTPGRVNPGSTHQRKVQPRNAVESPEDKCLRRFHESLDARDAFFVLVLIVGVLIGLIIWTLTR